MLRNRKEKSILAPVPLRVRSVDPISVGLELRKLVIALYPGDPGTSPPCPASHRLPYRVKLTHSCSISRARMVEGYRYRPLPSPEQGSPNCVLSLGEEKMT